MVKLKINTQNKELNLDCDVASNLKSIINSQPLNFRFPCGGKGKCGNCRVKVVKGIQTPTKVDEMKINQDELNQGVRLACCMHLNVDTELELNETEPNNLLG